MITQALAAPTSTRGQKGRAMCPDLLHQSDLCGEVLMVAAMRRQILRDLKYPSAGFAAAIDGLCRVP
jgi:hypothetical protein